MLGLEGLSGQVGLVEPAEVQARLELLEQVARLELLVVVELRQLQEVQVQRQVLLGEPLEPEDQGVL